MLYPGALVLARMLRCRSRFLLQPLIESCLADSKLTVERAAIIAAFCAWTMENVFDNPDVVKLAEVVASGLKRVKMALSSVP